MKRELLDEEGIAIGLGNDLLVTSSISRSARSTD
jgi:hypothetical protein